MLPFLKPKTVAGLIVAKRKPDGGKMEQYSEGNEDMGLESAAEQIIQAINAKDSKSLASAIRAAFTIIDSEDSPNDDSNDFDSQNEKAAQKEQA